MKERIDSLIFKQGLAKSRSQATLLIKNKQVFIDGKLVEKPSEIFDTEAKIEIVGDEAYVGRGGLKLQAAVLKFGIHIPHQIVLDVGASTGGFTDCLLRFGAEKVYAVDVGTDQLDRKLRFDPRVVSLEKTDIRELDKLSTTPTLAVIDVSFISLEMILEKVCQLIAPKGQIIALVKPQFETDQKSKNKSGVVKDKDTQIAALEKVKKFALTCGLKILGEMESPILGGSGNREFLLYLER